MRYINLHFTYLLTYLLTSYVPLSSRIDPGYASASWAVFASPHCTQWRRGRETEKNILPLPLNFGLSENFPFAEKLATKVVEQKCNIRRYNFLWREKF